MPEPRAVPLEQRRPEVLLKEIQQMLRRYNQEDSTEREAFFERYILPRLQTCASRFLNLTTRLEFSNPTIRHELRTVLTDYINGSSGGADLAEMLDQYDLTSLIAEPTVAQSTGYEIVDEDVEHLPKAGTGRRLDGNDQRAKHTLGRQLRGKGIVKSGPQQKHRAARQQREQTRWTEAATTEVLPPLEIPTVAEPLPAMHEQLFQSDGSIRSLQVRDVFGRMLDDQDLLITKDTRLIEQRLTALQESRSASALVDQVLQAIDRYLRDHEAELIPSTLIQSEADREYYPNDDLADAALRRYLRALLDWFPHVYNSSLDFPPSTAGSKSMRREELKFFLMDGLTKALNVVYRVLPERDDRRLPRNLNMLVDGIVRDFYYKKPHSAVENLDQEAA